MTDPSFDAAWRLVAVVDLMLLLASGTPLILALGRSLPRYARLAGWGYGVVMVVMVAAIAANTVTGATVTVGQRVLTGGITLPALWVSVLVFGQALTGWRSERDERRDLVIARVDDVVAWIDHVEHAAPCANPDCQRLRAEAVGFTRPR